MAPIDEILFTTFQIFLVCYISSYHHYTNEVLSIMIYSYMVGKYARYNFQAPARKHFTYIIHTISTASTSLIYFLTGFITCGLIFKSSIETFMKRFFMALILEASIFVISLLMHLVCKGIGRISRKSNSTSTELSCNDQII